MDKSLIQIEKALLQVGKSFDRAQLAAGTMGWIFLALRVDTQQKLREAARFQELWSELETKRQQ